MSYLLPTAAFLTSDFSNKKTETTIAMAQRIIEPFYLSQNILNIATDNIPKFLKYCPFASGIPVNSQPPKPGPPFVGLSLNI
jgi:hypothetical protein